MAKGITPVIAIILLLLITISITGVAFLFFQRTAQTATQAGEEQLNQQVSQAGSAFRIDGVDRNKVYITNLGANTLNSSDLVFFANNVKVDSQQGVLIPQGTLKEIVLNDTQLAAFGHAELRVVSSGYPDTVTIDFYATTTAVKSVSLLGKIIGNLGQVTGLPILNDAFMGIYASDLGAMTLFKNKIYFVLGDSYGSSCGYVRSFLVPYGTPASGLDGGIVLEDYLPKLAGSCSADAGKTLNDNGYTIPNAMFNLRQGTNEYMFAQYMVGGEFRDSDHHIQYSAFAKYNEATKMFDPYKQNIYKWIGTWRHFGMASFWPDYSSGYLYMVGSPSGRFGGVKLARIGISSFLDEANTDKWEYYLNDGSWSSDVDFAAEYGSGGQKGWRDVKWLIQPKYPEWSPGFEPDNIYAGHDSDPVYCSYITIGEFSVVYNPYLRKFILLTGRPCTSANGGGVFYYTAPDIRGPWSAEGLLVSSRISVGSTDYEWQQYGTYTTDALLKYNGKSMYFVATTWSRYGVYWYKAEFM